MKMSEDLTEQLKDTKHQDQENAAAGAAACCAAVRLEAAKYRRSRPPLQPVAARPK
jgi:hypothetical protein